MNGRVSEQVLNRIDGEYISEALAYFEKGNVWRRIGLGIGRVAAGILLLFSVSFSALAAAAAAGSMTAYDVLYSLYPRVAAGLTPVRESCEDNGIRMTVEGVDIHGDQADIYISMQDLTGDRIDETIDLFDSYSIHTSCDQIGGCSLVSADRERRMATFLIRVRQMGDEAITGKTMTFSVSEFLSGKTETEIELGELRLADAPVVFDVQTGVNVRGGSGGLAGRLDEGRLPGYLFPDGRVSFSPVSGAQITGYGFIADRLHIQAYYEDILLYDNHGYLYLKDPEGNTVHPAMTVAFWDGEQAGSYEESVFDMRPEELEGYAVWGYFSTCRTAVRGKWQVTFPIRQSGT